MCGIFAFFNLSNKQIQQPSVQSLKKSIEITNYRGPDYTGIRLFHENDSLKVFLGHNRLSIIDLTEDGNQPFSVDDRYHIVFNGEIYNYLELRESLINKGYKFKTKSDTEVLLKLYIDSGTKRFNELNGMWSFVIYDQVKNRIVASRDRFGVKPLYYLIQPEGIYFGSEIKQLNIHNTDIKINESTLSNYLFSYLIDNNNETFFKGISKCPGMHSMIIDLDRKKIDFERYWDFTDIDLSNYSTQELIIQYRDLLTSAIDLRLRSDVKIGNSLSGGLDSSTIAILANQRSEMPLYNYSIISNDKSVSEERFIDTLIAEKNLNVHKINFDEIDPWLDVEKVIYHHDEPILSLSTIAHYKMMEKLKENSDITVLLSGQGGDESLAGYNKYFYFNIKELLSEKKFLKAAKESTYLFSKMFGEFKWDHAKRYVSKVSSLDGIVKLPKSGVNLTTAKGLKDKQIEDILYYSVPALCHYEDRNSMASSLEIRLPFLDYRLVNFSLNLPSNMKIRNGVNKYILREAINELPRSIRYRTDKKGFTVNEKIRDNSTFLKILNYNFKDSVLAELGYLNIDNILNEIKLLESGKTGIWERELHRILFAEIWAKKFL